MTTFAPAHARRRIIAGPCRPAKVLEFQETAADSGSCRQMSADVVGRRAAGVQPVGARLSRSQPKKS